MRKRRHLLFLAFLFWYVFHAIAPVHAEPTFPELSGRVVDQANQLSYASINELTEMLERHETTTTNQVVVVTLQSLQGYDIDDYGLVLGNYWGIGQKGSNNGVLLIVAPNERKVRIEVGYGLESTLTNAICKNIIETVIIPHFKKDDMGRGIIQGTRAILATIEGIDFEE